MQPFFPRAVCVEGLVGNALAERKKNRALGSVMDGKLATVKGTFVGVMAGARYTVWGPCVAQIEPFGILFEVSFLVLPSRRSQRNSFAEGAFWG